VEASRFPAVICPNGCGCRDVGAPHPQRHRRSWTSMEPVTAPLGSTFNHDRRCSTTSARKQHLISHLPETTGNTDESPDRDRPLKSNHPKSGECDLFPRTICSSVEQRCTCQLLRVTA